MRRVTRSFKVGAVYADSPLNKYSAAYFTFVRRDSNTAFFKFLGDTNYYLQDENGLNLFYYPSEFWELSTKETNDLVAKGVIKL